MKLKYHGNRVFQKSFFTYFLLLLVVLCIGVGIYLQALRSQRVNAILDHYQEDARRTAEALDAKNSRLKSIQASIQQSPWVNKLITPAGTFADEFTIVRQADYQRDLMGYLFLDDSILDVAIFLPQKTLVVSQSGWFSLEDYNFHLNNKRGVDLSVLGNKLESYNSANSFQDFTYNSENNRCFIYLQSLEQLERPRATLMLLLNRSAYENNMRNIVGEYVSNLTVQSIEGMPLFSADIRPMGSGAVQLVQASNVYELEYCFSYPSAAEVLVNQQWISPFFWVFIVACMLTTCAVSFVLSRWTYRPLGSLVKHLSSKHAPDKTRHPKETEYEFIEKSFTQLYGENLEMRQTVQRYFLAARSDMLARLLRGHFLDDDNVEEQLAGFDIHFLENNWYAVLLICGLEKDGLEAYITTLEELDIMIPVQEVLKKHHQNHELLEAVDTYTVLILPFANEKIGTKLLNIVGIAIQTIIANAPQDLDVMVGKIYPGILGISKSYQNLKAQLQNPLQEYSVSLLEKDNPFYYPTDWEIQIIKELREGSLPVVSNILHELYMENLTRNLSRQGQRHLLSLIVNTMLRVVYELNLNDDDLLQQAKQILKSKKEFANVWNKLCAFAADICFSGVTFLSEQSFEVGSAREMIIFVQNNYTNPEMSLKMLGSRFNTSVQAASRMFKAATSVNFHDYTTRLRMEKAKVLMQQIGYIPTEIAKKIGYENEYTFTRAFLRSEKCKPREYCKKHSERKES